MPRRRARRSERWTQSAALAKPKSRARAGFASSIVPWAETSRTPAGSASSRRREAPSVFAASERRRAASSAARRARGSATRPLAFLGIRPSGARWTISAATRSIGRPVTTSTGHSGRRSWISRSEIARPDPRQLVLGEDGAETPGRDRPRQPGRVGRLLDLDLAEGAAAAAGRGARDRPRCRRRGGSAAGGSSASARWRRRRFRPPQGGQGAPQETSASAQNRGRVAQDVVQLTLHLCNLLHADPPSPVLCSRAVLERRSLAAGARVRRRAARASPSSPRSPRGRRRGGRRPGGSGRWLRPSGAARSLRGSPAGS